MDEIWRRLAWIVGSGGVGAMIGMAFGALTGAVHWGNGRAAGTFLGHRVLEAFESAGGREYSPRKRGTIVGATDGFLFLGVVGTLLGVVFTYVGVPDTGVFLSLAIGSFFVALAAVFFGMLAYALVRNGVVAVIGLFVGGMSGAFMAAMLFGADYLMLGVIPGIVLGTAASFLLRKYEPQYHEPRGAKAVHEKWRTDCDDLTTEANESGSDAIQKGQPSEE
jgi:hypothetical protein